MGNLFLVLFLETFLGDDFLGDIWDNFWVQQGWPFLVIRRPFQTKALTNCGKLINAFKQDAH